MKSITYLITGTPTRLNDCLDLAAKSSAAPTVSLSLKYLESCRETDILTQLAGGYHWTFGNNEVYIEIIYGGFSMLTGQVRRARIIDQANRRLAKDLTRLSGKKVTLIGAVRKFDESERCTAEKQNPFNKSAPAPA